MAGFRPVTFGVELEFLTPSLDGPRDILGYGTPTRKAIARELVNHTQGLSIAAECDDLQNCICVVCNSAPRENKVRGVCYLTEGIPSEPKEVSPAYRCFVLKPEHLLGPSRDDSWRGLELTTPVFGTQELDRGMPQLSQVIGAMRTMPAKLTANASCGMHVHVGVQQEGMSILVAQKLTTLVFLLEQQLLFRLCGPSRRQNPCSAPVTQRSEFQAHASRGEWVGLRCDSHTMRPYMPRNIHNVDDAVRKCLRLLWDCDSLTQIARGLDKSAGKRCAFALALRAREPGVDKRPTDPKEASCFYSGGPSTFEFRYMQMAFDMVLVANWSELCCRLVEIATLEAGAFRGALQNIIAAFPTTVAGSRDGWMDILAALGLEHQIDDWCEQLAWYDQGKEISCLDEQGMLV